MEVIHCCWCCGYISLQEKCRRKGKIVNFYSLCVAFTKRLSLGKTNKSFLCWANLFHFGCTIQVPHLDVQIRLAAVFSFSLVCQSSANVLANAHLQWDWATLALILQTIYFCSICKPFMSNLNILYNFTICKFAHWTICIFANLVSFICLRLCKSFLPHFAKCLCLTAFLFFSSSNFTFTFYS